MTPKRLSHVILSVRILVAQLHTAGPGCSHIHVQKKKKREKKREKKKEVLT